MKIKFIVFVILMVYGFNSTINAKLPEVSYDTTRLVVIWSSGDPEVAEKVCFMYTHAAKRNKWFDEVVLIVWGPSAKLLTENTALQKKIKTMAKDGVKLQACVACARMYGDDVVEKLKELGF